MKYHFTQILQKLVSQESYKLQPHTVSLENLLEASTASPHMFSICKVVHLLIKNIEAGFYLRKM
jgi:hypothetical protein